MKSKAILFTIIIFVTCAAQIASDIYAPSLPAISHSLGTSLGNVQFSMAIYMFALAFSQLFYGPLSEGLGRKIPLLLGLIILLIGDLICLYSLNISWLMLGRLLQGCGAGACATLWRSIFRDTFQGEELAKYGAYFSILVTLVVPAAPLLGGYLQETFTWRASFLFLALYSLLTLVMVMIWLEETNKYQHFNRLNAKFVARSFIEIFSSAIFMGYTLCTFLCYGAFFSWFAAGPVLLIHILGMTPVEFGWISLVGGGLATALGGWISGKYVMRLGRHTMLRIGFVMMLISGSMMLLGYLSFGMNIPLIVIPMILFYFGVSFIWPSAFAGAFAPFGKTAGYAGAVYGFMQISGAAVIGTLVSYLPDKNQVPLALVFMSSAILSWLVFEKMIHVREIRVSSS